MHWNLSHVSGILVGTIVISALVIYGVSCDFAKALRERSKQRSKQKNREKLQEWWDKRLSESCLVCGAKVGEYCDEKSHAMHIDRLLGEQ